jgi:hypothetical protein
MFHHVSQFSAFILLIVPTLLSAQSPLIAPASAVQAPHTNRQFTALSRDSVATSVSFSATGGTISSDGVYTAGSVPGTFRVIARSGALADTSAVTVTAPLGTIQEPTTKQPITVPSKDRTDGPRPPEVRYESEQGGEVKFEYPDGTTITVSGKKKETWTFVASLIVLMLVLNAACRTQLFRLHSPAYRTSMMA